jgi:hypothetical protein
MTPEEAETHNRAPSACPEPDSQRNENQAAMSSSSFSKDKVLLYAPSAKIRDVPEGAGSRGRSSEVTGISRIPSMACQNENDGGSGREENARTSPLVPSEMPRFQYDRPSGSAGSRIQRTESASGGVVEPAKAINLNDGNSAPSASVSDECSRNPPRQPVPALASPMIESSNSVTVPLRITPKANSTAATGYEQKSVSPAGGEQPWSRHWVDIREALDRCAMKPVSRMS